MLLIGAKGFATEVLQILLDNDPNVSICFYDDVSPDAPDILFGRFPVLKSKEQARDYFNNDPKFTVAIGNPILRRKMTDQFEELGGTLSSVISHRAYVSHLEVEIAPGCIIMPGVHISPGVSIGRCTMIYYKSVITHEVQLGEFCEISPSVNVLGNAVIGDQVHLATASIIFPKVNIGNSSIVAAGAVVRENVPENTLVAGVPAVIKKALNL